MSDDELEGVLAHEVAHVANGDMVTMALVQGVVNAFVMFFARIVTFAIDNFLRGDDEEGGGLGFFASMFVNMGSSSDYLWYFSGSHCYGLFKMERIQSRC